MPVPLSEADAIDLVLLAIGQAFQRCGAEMRGVDRTHLLKAVHRLADGFDLPITRCWFKFGQFVISDRASTDRLLLLAPGRASEVSPVLQRLLASELRPLQQHVIQAAEGLIGFFREPLNEILPSYYAEEAPPEFSPLYVANFELTTFCRRLEDIEDYRGRRVHYSENLRPKLIQFHKAVAKVLTDAEALGTVIKYWLFVEEHVLRMDFQMAKMDFKLASWKALFKRVVDEYLARVWNLPSSVIARETVVGPGAEDWKRQMAKVLSSARNIEGETMEPLREEADSLGFLPSPSETRESLAEARQRAGTRADAIDQLVSSVDTDEP